MADLPLALADEQVRILHLLRSRDEVRETLEGVEIALDSKQQELELVKRRFGVKGVGGCTPATGRTSLASGGSTTVFAPSASAVSRRHSVAPATPSVPSASASSHLSLGGMPETPGPFGRPTAGAAARPRSSLAMGTPGLKHVPGSSTRTSVGGRPRSSAAGDLSASTSSSTAAFAAASSVPTPSTASRAPSARAAAAATVVARLSISTSGAQNPATPFGRTSSMAQAASTTTTMTAVPRLLAESNATPRRSSFAPAAAGKTADASSQPTPRRSLSTSVSSTTPGGAVKARRLSVAARPTVTEDVFPSIAGVAPSNELDGVSDDKENVEAYPHRRQSSLLA